jgi:hypothetical protein
MRRDWSKHPLVVFGPLVLSALALAASVVALVIANESPEREGAPGARRTLSVQAVAVANHLMRTEAGLGIAVSLANESLQPVIVRDASLWFEGRRLGTASGYVSDAAVLNSIDEDPGRVADETRPLPFTLDAREARTVGIFISDEELSTTAGNEKQSDDAAQEIIQRWKVVLMRLKPAARHHVELRLQLLPGGTKSFGVRVDPAMTPPRWEASFRPLGQTGVVMGLRRRGFEPGQGGVIRLDLWARDGDYKKSLQRPLVGNALTSIPLRSLPRGAYWYAFRLGERTVVTGCFIIPGVFGRGTCSSLHL